MKADKNKTHGIRVKDSEWEAAGKFAKEKGISRNQQFTEGAKLFREKHENNKLDLNEVADKILGVADKKGQLTPQPIKKKSKKMKLVDHIHPERSGTYEVISDEPNKLVLKNKKAKKTQKQKKLPLPKDFKQYKNAGIIHSDGNSTPIKKKFNLKEELDKL